MLLEETASYMGITEYFCLQLVAYIHFTASPLLMTGHRQSISRFSKGDQNILIYNFIIITFDCQGSGQGRGISAKAFALACQEWRHHCHFIEFFTLMMLCCLTVELTIP